MQKTYLALIATLSPMSALAHQGHGGFGAFHHAGDALPWLALVAAVWLAWRLVFKR